MNFGIISVTPDRKKAASILKMAETTRIRIVVTIKTKIRRI